MKKITQLVQSKSFTDAAKVGEISEDENLRGFNHGSNVMAVTPIFLAGPEIVEVFDDNDLEANNVCDPNHTKSST
ncbi:hypothetical protein CASFOL_019838 [Castilleja foliolosa]|uniref:Uncharacterized protein n=1 Tax=Castilleja foliolosa TaxID=1961234 RepID=A0ABD3D2P3_9LAMI